MVIILRFEPNGHLLGSFGNADDVVFMLYSFPLPENFSKPLSTSDIIIEILCCKVVSSEACSGYIAFVTPVLLFDHMHGFLDDAFGLLCM